MSGPSCPRCGTTRPTRGTDCPCAGTAAHEWSDTKLFTQAWVRPYLGSPPHPASSSDGTPDRYAGDPHDRYAADPHAGARTAPGPALGIMRAYTALRPEWDPARDDRAAGPLGAPLPRHHIAPDPGHPRGPDSPAGPRPPCGDDTLRLRPVVLPPPVDAAPAPREVPGARGSHRKAASARHAADRSGSARVAGAVAMLAAVVGTTTLTGVMLKTGGSEQRATPQATTASVAAAETSTAPPPSGPAAEDQELTVAAAGTPSRSPSPSASPHATRPAPVTTPKPVVSAGGRTRCAAPHLPGAPCPSTGRPRTASPSRTPAALCCGASGPEVADLQYRLRVLGRYEGRVNGNYNQRLTDAVASYQRSRGITLDPSGWYGPATRAALRREVPDVVAR
ncbi:peptidoglycan-binding protein [Streptomyces sp. NBC_01216]|uniref:peptidoglycan-binding domain-containing protein n=2 Tax=unclassified Streptomyces TaxID=2593676 RepID=UPI002E12480B|nr:peptidoglycan-binding protein [Streptomyces sp. NBC_01216]